MSRARTSEPSSRPLQFAGAVSACVWICAVCVCCFPWSPRRYRSFSPVSVSAPLCELLPLSCSAPGSPSALPGATLPSRWPSYVGVPGLRALQAFFPFHTKAWKAAIQEAAWRPSSSSDVESSKSRKGMLPYMRAAEEV